MFADVAEPVGGKLVVLHLPNGCMLYIETWSEVFAIGCPVKKTVLSGYTVNFAVNNNSGSTIDGWKLVIEIDGLDSVIDKWNGIFTTNGNKITVTNESYNNIISNGGTCYFGCRIIAKNGVKIKSATLNGSAVEIIS